MSDWLQPTSDEIDKWRTRGGVDLTRREPGEERHHAAVELRVGVMEEPKVIYTFRCPLCGRVERNNQAMSPCCTGPSWTDDHPLEAMDLV